MTEQTQERKRWEQQDGESDLHYSWFHTYLLLGPSRSLLGAFNQFEAQKSPPKPAKNTVSGAWKNAAEKWSWQARAGAYDALERQKALQAAEQRRQERMQATLDDAYEVGELFLQKAKKMGMLPITRTKANNGQTIIEAAEPDYFNSAVRLAKEGTALRRQSLDMDKDPKAGGGANISTLQPHDEELSTLSDDELLERLLRRLTGGA